MRRKRIYSFECLEQKLALDGATPIPPPVGITAPIDTVTPSPTDLDNANDLVDSILSPTSTPAPLPVGPTAAPNFPIAISQYDNFGNLFTVVSANPTSPYTVCVPAYAVWPA